VLRESDFQSLQSAAPTLLQMTANDLSRSVECGSIIADHTFGRGKKEDLGAFYAPFDWINDEADIVLIGITPGKQQAEAALLAARNALSRGASISDAARDAKQEASFKGDMRQIAATLMDHFDMHRLFGLSSCSALFGEASHRVHYTSAFRYPVLELKKGDWSNYSGGTWVGHKLLRNMIEDHLVPELEMFRKAWLVPFGPTPAEVLSSLAERGLVNSGKVLAGLNHPTGTQWNRHKCQLDRIDHSGCAKNVGCRKIQARSAALRAHVSAALVG
jgi:hypothetical protein